ncbi:alpha/beta fold hydrolase, partial [Candidatus Binatia bacterium]|nr:alpha/beta fold hydrolase [Candidatus Binatia bacterium]
MMWQRGYLDTTCGAPGKVACGRVSARATSRPVSCRITTADRCTSRTSWMETACAAQTHCTDVVEWTAGTCVDPRAPGPFAVGVRTVTYTKPSVETGAPRALDTVIWYPAPAGAGAIDPALRGIVDAPVAVSDAPYPVVLFSHGMCGSPRQSLFLTPLLASRGFVVVAPSHPGNTTADIPFCLTSESLVSSFRERPSDVVFVLDQVLAANADRSSPLFGALDATRIAMTGHSFGGLTAYLVEDIEPRIKAAIAMAPAILQPQAFAVPSMTLLGQEDGVLAVEPMRTAWQTSAPPKHLVEIEDAGHYAFSDFCRAGSDCRPPATLTSAEAHAHVLRWVQPFLERYLNDDAAFAPFFRSAEPGVVVRSED